MSKGGSNGLVLSYLEVFINFEFIEKKKKKKKKEKKKEKKKKNNEEEEKVGEKKRRDKLALQFPSLAAALQKKSEIPTSSSVPDAPVGKKANMQCTKKNKKEIEEKNNNNNNNNNNSSSSSSSNERDQAAALQKISEIPTSSSVPKENVGDQAPQQEKKKKKKKNKRNRAALGDGSEEGQNEGMGSMNKKIKHKRWPQEG
eukprot:CAMPEP_0174985612 /NCGR_PEP_ID=MMETSP0004_2-20121128/18439_1 /TAXON_ID=420556 /ORGANISM="Ochromonas sp., Strain CCMP1393" /LENGTH=199 /DNA_ID=CAMNT_0016238281 /DNA_START=24 /DNA_END=623 /DNA_ORIENTATION=+